jgi:hypothetical protein
VTTDEAIDSTLAMLRACPPDDTVHGEPRHHPLMLAYDTPLVRISNGEPYP